MKADNLSLIAAVNHATDTLGLYRAELARILGLNCADVSDSQNLELLFASNSSVRSQAELFVYFFQLLEILFPDDTVAMVHWFRRENSKLGTTPFLAMVDHGQLGKVVDVLQKKTGSALRQ
ncbi:MAG: hypothetical protein LJE83_00955 [Gammaproteobacteria bacterium]|jgi:hypothetical protein|nr:hypothetical protein [Gammaproteobacteria bacterium]